MVLPGQYVGQTLRLDQPDSVGGEIIAISDISLGTQEKTVPPRTASGASAGDPGLRMEGHGDGHGKRQHNENFACGSRRRQDSLFYNPRCSSNELSCLSRELMANQPAIRPKCPFEDLFRRLKQRYSRAASQAVWKGTLGKQESELRSTGLVLGAASRMSPNVKEVRTIVVTGGADGIGRAVVQLCAARGDNLAVLDKNVEAAKMAAEDAIKRGAKCALDLCCDVSSEEQIEKAFEIIWNKLGVPYGLFTSAAVDLGGLVHELPAATWHEVLETNLN